MSPPWEVILVEDDARLRGELELGLRDRGYSVRVRATAEEAQGLLAGRELARVILLIDVRLPGMSGVELVSSLAQRARLPPTLVISGEASLSEAVAVLRLGVDDFLEKPFSLERLDQSIRRTLELRGLRQRVVELESRVDETDRLIGDSAVMKRLRRDIARAAVTEGRVLILGETGCGKELVAASLHRQSRRSHRPFVRLNCAALPATLVEDELFGHVRGAFTGAHRDRRGLFETADGGTLLLDEIGDMDPALQGRLLRVLEDGAVRRLGDSQEREVEVRVIAATHCDLLEITEFRRDLYYRLAHLPLEVPPLRERNGDVRQLFDFFLERQCARNRVPLRKVEPEVYRSLERYPWPGNVRELAALCERLVVLGGDPITSDQLPSAITEPAPLGAETGLLRLRSGGPLPPLRELRAQCEREYLELVLRRTGWNVAAAARILAVGRTHLHERIRRLGLRRR